MEVPFEKTESVIKVDLRFLENALRKQSELGFISVDAVMAVLRKFAQSSEISNASEGISVIDRLNKLVNEHTRTRMELNRIASILWEEES